MFTKARMLTVAMTVVLIAVAMRTEQGKDLLTGDSKFLGIF